MKIISSKNTGFSLIEILVSLVVLSVGLMGLGGLQIAALKGTNEAHYRTEASLLMINLADRMHANIGAPNEGGVSDGDYRSNIAVSCATAPAKRCDTLSCNSTELAAFDLYSIACGINSGTRKSAGIKDLLPQGELRITCSDNDCSNAEGALEKMHNITISWKVAKSKSENLSNGNLHNVKSISLSIVP